MKQITPAMLATLGQQAQASPRRRANLNLHPQLDDPIQRLAIAMEPDTYVRPHRHPHTWEMLHPLAGRFVVLEFDESARPRRSDLRGQARPVSADRHRRLRALVTCRRNAAGCYAHGMVCHGTRWRTLAELSGTHR